MLIKFVGADRLAEAVEENIACARYFEELVKASDDFEMLAPVELSVFCFRYKAFDNKRNERLLVELNRRGSTYLSNATIRGTFALRGCVLNYRTTKADMERVLEDVRETAKTMMATD